LTGALEWPMVSLQTPSFLSLGIPPSIASACIHTAEMFTTGVSGISHFKFGNVDKKNFLKAFDPGSDRRRLRGLYSYRITRGKDQALCLHLFIDYGNIDTFQSI